MEYGEENMHADIGALGVNATETGIKHQPCWNTRHV